MIDRRTFIRTLGVCVFAPPLAAATQPAGKVYRIGLVGSEASLADVFGPTPRWPHWGVFLEELRRLGWVEGQNIQFERRSDEGRPERRTETFEELVRLHVDVLVTVSNPMARAAIGATRTIPIVMITMGAPVEDGLVTSLSRPGGNLTGLSVDSSPEIGAKRLQLLKEVVPRGGRVTVLRASPRPGRPPLSPEIEAAARALRVALLPVFADAPDQFERAFASAARDRADALLVADNLPNLVHSRLIVALAVRHRLPAVYPYHEFMESGGLMAYSPDMVAMFRRAATYVDKILKGAKPADLPIEQPTKFELLINLRTAKALGLTIPPSLLLRADQVIE
jgi:putative ABC transport system substrate-binding protein